MFSKELCSKKSDVQKRVMFSVHFIIIIVIILKYSEHGMFAFCMIAFCQFHDFDQKVDPKVGWGLRPQGPSRIIWGIWE